MHLKEIFNEYLPSEATTTELVTFFSMFSHETRLKILSILSISKLCVSDIVNILSLNQTTVSHQLKTLKNANIIDNIRQGKKVYYFIVKESVYDIMLEAVRATESDY